MHILHKTKAGDKLSYVCATILPTQSLLKLKQESSLSGNDTTWRASSTVTAQRRACVTCSKWPATQTGDFNDTSVPEESATVCFILHIFLIHYRTNINLCHINSRADWVK
jgi:hypothetical protein